MARGVVRGDARRYPASIAWIGAANDEVIDLKPIPLLSDSPEFLGYRCATCGIVEIDYRQPSDQ